MRPKLIDRRRGQGLAANQHVTERREGVEPLVLEGQLRHVGRRQLQMRHSVAAKLGPKAKVAAVVGAWLGGAAAG